MFDAGMGPGEAGLAAVTAQVLAPRRPRGRDRWPLPAARRIGCAADLDAIFRPHLSGLAQEVFAVALLDTQRGVIDLGLVSVGILDASLVHPREVFRRAILCNAAEIAMAHNHPSGNPEPSPEDIALTRRLVQAGQVIGITVTDHLILGGPRYVSLHERGLV